MKILPLHPSHIDEASALFASAYLRLRSAVPSLPETMQDPSCTVEKLDNLLAHSAGVAAVEGGQLVGYLGWWLIDDFRDSGRKTGYVPVWAHAVQPDLEAPATLALYRAAAEIWYAAGCHAHAITLLADNPLRETFWFWNGFGMLVVDAIRPARPLNRAIPQGMEIRKATLQDAPLAAALEVEHMQHYGKPPVLMIPSSPSTTEEFQALIANPANSVWIAYDHASPNGEAAGYLRLEGNSSGAAEVVRSDTTIAITGEYVRPACRGRGVAPALLDAALRYHAANGYTRCSVDFESINPEAAAYWPRYFTPVCYSLMRVPEKHLA